ncbi:MAG: glycoside hydrolase family 3 N-terminal domain-containing protein [Cytophagales bacterium]|nr:glycoside hydrolase family 3 N-terminal domain-containing protein [Cytophagales bacterium]
MKIYLLSILLLLSLVTKSQEQDSLDIMIGQMIMAGVRDFQQTDLREELLLNLEQGKIGGVVLFEKNVPKTNTKQGLIAMIDTLQAHASIPLLVSIDEEGGIVNRLKPKYGFDDPPSAQQLGAWDNTDTTYFYAQRIADNLKSLGINLNYAPVVDLNVNPKNPIIGGIGRSFSADYLEVVEHAAVYIQAHRDANVGTALKHFPGHGSSAKDTHKGIADVSKTFVIEELYPYKMLIDSGKVDAVMTSHVMNRILADSLPGTLSKRVVDGVLRGFLGYDGVVFSDDMQMKAITNHYGLETSVKLSILAGVDILVYANHVLEKDVIPVNKLFNLMKQLVNSGEIPEERIRESYKRIMDFKVQLGLLEVRRSYEPRK